MLIRRMCLSMSWFLCLLFTLACSTPFCPARRNVFIYFISISTHTVSTNAEWRILALWLARSSRSAPFTPPSSQWRRYLRIIKAVSCIIISIRRPDDLFVATYSGRSDPPLRIPRVWEDHKSSMITVSFLPSCGKGSPTAQTASVWRSYRGCRGARRRGAASWHCFWWWRSRSPCTRCARAAHKSWTPTPSPCAARMWVLYLFTLLTN